MKFTTPALISSTLLTSLIVATTSYAAIAGLNEGDAVGTTEVEIITALEALGATIDEVETEDGMIEVEFTVDGQEYEVEVDEATGLVAEIEAEDADDSDEEDEDDDDKQAG